jgi:hypothetical protein
MSSSDFVALRGGLTLPLPAVELAIDLERRGLQLRVEKGDVLCVGPRDRLTDEDRAALRRWKAHVLALLTYNADAPRAASSLNVRPTRPI